jgi:hypothetical protein
VVFLSGYNYLVSAASYFINGVLYASPQQLVTLDPADPLYDRFDVIILQADGVVAKLTGTPSATPLIPTTEAFDYIALSTIFVAAGSAGDTVDSTFLYEEGVEWSFTLPTGMVLRSTTDPYQGTYCLEAVNTPHNSTLLATYGTPFDITTQNNLVFYIKPTSPWPADMSLRFRWRNGSLALGTIVVVNTGQLGFDSQNTTAYQQIVIPITAFNLPQGTLVDNLRIFPYGSTGETVSFRMDYLMLQSGVPLPPAVINVVHMGAYGSGVAYARNNIVTYEDGSYIALTGNNNKGKTPTTNPSFWGALNLNKISTLTRTPFTGLVKGNGTKLQQAVADVDYASATAPASAIIAHVAAVDPHGDRAAATTALSDHVAAVDPHGDRAAATTALSDHVAAVDPHGDRAYTDTAVAGVTKVSIGLGNVDNVQQMPLSYLDTDPTLSANSNTRVPSQAALVTYINNTVGAANAMVLAGYIDASADPNFPPADKGNAFVITVSGHLGGALGPAVEVGDIALCLVNGTPAGDQATVGANWLVLQRNLDGVVTGPAVSTHHNVAFFDGATGKILVDLGITLAGSFLSVSAAHHRAHWVYHRSRKRPPDALAYHPSGCLVLGCLCSPRLALCRTRAFYPPSG